MSASSLAGLLLDISLCVDNCVVKGEEIGRGYAGQGWDVWEDPLAEIVLLILDEGVQPCSHALLVPRPHGACRGQVCAHVELTSE